MPEHRFGGRHTEEKLSILKAYLTFYSTALKDLGFVLTYIDAFAGSGSRTETLRTLDLIGELVGDPNQITYPGSARIALSVDPPLHLLVFIEKNLARFKSLEALRQEFPDRKIKVHNGDAEVALEKLCKGLPWRGPDAPGNGMRAVLFLDPYGMHVPWSTLEHIRDTRAIDLWYLFPINAVQRQAALDFDRVDAHKDAALTRIFGDDRWKRLLYSEPLNSAQMEMFEAQQPKLRRDKDANAIEKLFQEELKGLFPYVAPNPRKLMSNGVHMFSLFFAVSNKSGPAIALASRVAEHILSSR